MKYLLTLIKHSVDKPAPEGARLGRYLFLAYSDGTMVARQDHTGLMSPEVQQTRAGLNRLLAWIEQMEKEEKEHAR